MKKLLLTSAIFASTLTSGAFAQSVNDLEVNQYDCSVEEVINYMNKRTSSLKKDTGIATWSDFKNNAVYITSSSQGGNPPSSATAGTTNTGGVNPTGANGGGGLFAGCPTFNMPDADFSMPDFGQINDFINGFSLSNPLDGLNQQISNAIDDLISDMTSEGFCAKLRDLQADVLEQAQDEASEFYDSFSDDVTSQIADEISSMTNEDLSQGTSGAGNEYAFIDDAVNDALGPNGKLLNVYDSRLDDDRERVKNQEKDRQKDKLVDQILGREQ